MWEVLVYNGKLIITPSYERVCPLEIKASSDADCYVYLKYVRAPSSTTVDSEVLSGKSSPYESNMAFYVQSGETVEVDVPIGVYKLYYATGDVFYGKKDLFGSTTNCYTSIELLEFAADNTHYKGCSLTLYKVVNGNYSTNSISEGSFPTD